QRSLEPEKGCSTITLNPLPVSSLLNCQNVSVSSVSFFPISWIACSLKWALISPKPLLHWRSICLRPLTRNSPTSLGVLGAAIFIWPSCRYIFPNTTFNYLIKALSKNLRFWRRLLVLQFLLHTKNFRAHRLAVLGLNGRFRGDGIFRRSVG